MLVYQMVVNMELEPNLCCLWMFMDVYGCLWGLENIFHIVLNGFQLLDMAS